MNATGTRIAFITGDLYWSGPDPNEYSENEEDSIEEEDEFLEAVSNLKAQWYPVMGNHEANGEDWAVTQELIFGGGVPTTRLIMVTAISSYWTPICLIPGRLYLRSRWLGLRMTSQRQ